MIYRSGYNKLAEWALSRSLCRWPLRPKNHYVEHWVLDTSPQNARYLHNYLQEDMIRRIKNLAAKSHPAFLSKHVMFKYVLQRTLSWAEESKTSVRSRGGSPSSRSTLKPWTLNPKTPTVGATDVVVVGVFVCVCVLLYMCIYVCKYIYIYRFVRHVLFSTLFWLMVFGSKCTRPVGINTSTE